MARDAVLLTGASGLVGTWLRRTVPADVEPVALVHRTPVPGLRAVGADLCDAAAVAAALAEVRPSLVIHAGVAGDEASIVDATANVASAAASVGAGLVHLSTDAVFSGDGVPVDESARPEPVFDYGRWKLRAEDAVRAASATSAVLRLPLVVSPDPPDAAVRRIRDGAAAGDVTSWFDDELRQPAMAVDLAAAIWRIAGLAPDQRGGVWHLTGAETLSRHEIGVRVARALRFEPSVVAGEPTPPGLARPRHLALTHERARREIAWDPAPILS